MRAGELTLAICEQLASGFEGSFFRSAVNHESGAKNGLSGIVMGIIMCCAVLFMTPIFEYIPQTGTTITDQMNLLREQVKMLAGEVALCTSSLKRLSEQAASNPKDSQLQVEVKE